MRRRVLAPVLTLFALAVPAAAMGQDQEQTSPPDSTSAAQQRAQDIGDPQLVFEREVFTYPTFQRRNPFKPLLANASGGPRFEQMHLDAILFSPTPGSSVATLSAGRPQGGNPGSGPIGQSVRLHVGERWGNVRIVEIRRSQVVVEVTEFGLTERRTMDMPTRGQGGSR